MEKNCQPLMNILDLKHSVMALQQFQSCRVKAVIFGLCYCPPQHPADTVCVASASAVKITCSFVFPTHRYTRSLHGRNVIEIDLSQHLFSIKIFRN